MSLSSIAASFSNTGGAFSATGVKIPTFSIGDTGTPLFGNTTASSPAEAVQSLVDSASNIISAARLVACVGQVLSNPGALAGLLSDITSASLGVAGLMGKRILAAVDNQINILTGSITGTAVSTIKTWFSLLSAIYNLCDAVVNLIDYISNLSLKGSDFWKTDAECQEMLGVIGRCLLNKYFGSKITEMTNSIVSKINEVGSNVNKTVQKELNNQVVINNYVENQAFMLKKATKQINGITHYNPNA